LGATRTNTRAVTTSARRYRLPRPAQPDPPDHLLRRSPYSGQGRGRSPATRSPY